MLFKKKKKSGTPAKHPVSSRGQMVARFGDTVAWEESRAGTDASESSSFLASSDQLAQYLRCVSR